MRYLLALLVVAGCSSAHSRVVYTPDGSWAYRVSCKYAYECAEEAQRLCPKGDSVLAAGDETVGAIAQTYRTSNVTSVTVAQPIVAHVMVVRCRGGVVGKGPTD